LLLCASFKPELVKEVYEKATGTGGVKKDSDSESESEESLIKQN